MKFLAVITAYDQSQRLAHKNLLPLGRWPLMLRSVQDGLRAGLRTVLAASYPEMGGRAERMGAEYVAHLASPCTHEDAIRDAVAQAGAEDCHVVLLQPTSPFRIGGIVEACLAAATQHPERTVLSVQTRHCWLLDHGNLGQQAQWDGCVAIYPPGRVGDYSQIAAVPNHYLNGLQIDGEADYVQACQIEASLRSLPDPLGRAASERVQAALVGCGLSGGPVTLVGRGNGQPIPQDAPVFYINHCHGWDGQRADGLVIIANPDIRRRGISQAAREVAAKAKLVIVRDNGEFDWLAQNLPEMAGKTTVRVDRVSEHLSNHLQTGTLAHDMLRRAGCQVRFIGQQSPAEMALAAVGSFNQPGVSREIAMLF